MSKCLCIMCGDPMVEESNGVWSCDCPQRGYRSKQFVTPLRPELRPPIDQLGMRHVLALFIILVMFFAAFFDACLPMP